MAGVAVLVWLLICGVVLVRRTAITVRHLQGRVPASASPTPLSVAVIVACKNAGPGLAAKMTRLLEQQWPNYRVIFVTGTTKDSAHPVLTTLMADHSRATLLESGPSTHSGQKVHNLVCGLNACRDVDVVLVADSDGDYPADWIASMTGPMADPRVGATLGAPWFLPETPTLWSRSLSWSLNTHALLYLARPNPIAGWGGAMGFRMGALNAAGIPDLWTRVVYDDVTAVTALSRCGIRRVFVGPAIPSFFPARTFSECLRWFTRQLIAARIYAAPMYRDGCVVHFPLMIAELLAIPLVMLAVAWPPLIPAAVVAMAASVLQWVMGTWIERAAGYGSSWSVPMRASLGAVLSAIAGAWASMSRRFIWAGTTYELVSDTETRIVDRADP